MGLSLTRCTMPNALLIDPSCLVPWYSAPMSSADRPWTTRRLLAWMGDAFADKGIDSPRLCAELLMAHVIGCERLRLYMDADRPASPLERQNLRDLVARALKHEPVQYLVGEGWFFGLPMRVDRRVMIPRPATETIVEHILQHARAEPGFGGPRGDGLVIADVCTGSGCVAIALAKRLPGAHVIATDISPDALDVARDNAQRHDVADRIELLEGDLLEPLTEHPATRGQGTIHYLAANPPYIPDDEWDAVAPNVRDFEPALALRGGPDGLDVVQPIIEQAPDRVCSGGLVLVEVADSRAMQAHTLMADQPGITDTRILDDCDGLPRVIVGRRV